MKTVAPPSSKPIGCVSACITLALALTVLFAWGIPKYRIYVQTMRGEAMLREAEWTKKVAIEEARAKEESATLEAKAEIARAKGVAEANTIIGDSLKDNSEYLRYLWINGLKSDGTQVIYVPTEAGLPILEAGKREADQPTQ